MPLVAQRRTNSSSLLAPGASIVEPATVVAAGAVATSKKLVASEKEEADVEEAEWETEEDEEVDDKELELEVGDALEQVMREEIMKKLKEKRERTGSDKRAEQQMAEDDAELERLTQEYFEFGRDRQKFMERALGTDENDEVPWGDEEDPEDEDNAAAPPPEPLTEDERLLQQLRAERGEPAFLQPAADNANAVDEIEATEEDLEEGAPSKKKPHTRRQKEGGA